MTFKDIISDFSADGLSSDLSGVRMLVGLSVALLISLYIFFEYKRYARDGFYSKNFNVSLALMPVVTAGIILAIQSNLIISLGMVGALSIVRYRTAIKSSLDLFFMFWAVSVGIICGAGQFALAVGMSVTVSVLLAVLNRFDFTDKTYMLVIECRNIQDLTETENDIKKSVRFLSVKSKQATGGMAKGIFEYKPKKDADLAETLSENQTVQRFQIISND